MTRDSSVTRDVAPGITAGVAEVARMLDPLDDGGRHLAHAVGHGHPARGAHLARDTWLVLLGVKDVCSDTTSTLSLHLAQIT